MVRILGITELKYVGNARIGAVLLETRDGKFFVSAGQWSGARSLNIRTSRDEFPISVYFSNDDCLTMEELQLRQEFRTAPEIILPEGIHLDHPFNSNGEVFMVSVPDGW